MRILIGACVAALAVFAARAAAQEPPASLADRLIAAYSPLGSYCDTGRSIEWSAEAVSRSREMRHCVARDGRYKSELLANAGDGRAEVRWSDAAGTHAYYRNDGASGFNSYSTFPHVASEKTDIPPILRVVLDWYLPGATSLADLRERLGAFTRRPDLDEGALEAFESNDEYEWARRRVWLSREGLIRRVGGADPETQRWRIEDIRVDVPLSAEDLDFEAPSSARAFDLLKRHPARVAALALAGSFVSGLLFWRWRWSSRSDYASYFTARARWWRWQKWLWLALIPVFAAACFWPSDGNVGGLIRQVMRMAWAFAYLFGLVLLLLFSLGAHIAAPMQRSGALRR